MPSAYLLVTHGSRDLRYQAAIAHLTDRVQQKMSAKVGMAVLECSPMALHQQIEQFCQHSNNVQIVPLFLLPGVHVMEDIPDQIAIAQPHLQAKLTVTPHLGSDANLAKLLAKRFATVSSDGRILLSHGSRRSQGNCPIERLATELNAVPAFWSVSPDLGLQVQELVQQGCQEIAILPYFLFPGGITDAIAQKVHDLAEQFPRVTLQLLTPLDVREDFVNLVVDFLATQNLPDPVMPVL